MMQVNEARRLLAENVGDGNNAGARLIFNHLSVSEAATKDRILASKRQNNIGSNVEEDIIQVRGVLIVDLAADDDEVEIVEVEEGCGSEDNDASGDAIESGEEEERVLWERIGLQMVPVCVKKACEVSLKRIPTSKRRDRRKAIGLRSSERIQQLKMAAKKSNLPSIPTRLYNNKKVAVQFVADGLSSFSSPFPPTPFTPPTHSLSSSTSTSPLCLPATAHEIRKCQEKGEQKGKEDNFEKLGRRLEVCAKEIKQCEEKEMDWAGGAGSRYIKAGKLN